MMQKITLFFILLIGGVSLVWSQSRQVPSMPFTENFEVRPAPISNASRLPGDTLVYLGFDGMDIVDTVAAPNFGLGIFDEDSALHSGPLQGAGFPPASNWLIFFEELSPGDTNRFAGISSWFTDPTIQSDDWITFGPIVVPAGGAEFTWRHLIPDNGFRDGYEVLVGTDGPFPGDFGSATQLLSYSDNDPGTNGDTVWTAQSVMLDAGTYAGDTVFMAVHHNAQDMFFIYFDDLTVVESGATSSVPLYPINLITDDAIGDGIGDSLGVMCRVRGTVHGVDLQGSGSVQFTIIDNTGGIGLFSSNNFGYTVNEGDEVLVQGVVSHFNGLTQMGSLDTIQVLSTGNPLQTPTAVTMLSEDTESEMTTLACFKFVDPADWDGTGGSFNIDVTDGTNTETLRIDNDVDLANMTVPTGNWFDFTGIGGQFDSSNPHLDGYQLLPRYAADIVALPDPTVAFDASTDMIGEGGGMITVGVSQDDGNPDVTQITVELDAGASTATEGMDFTFSTTTIDLSGKGTSSDSFDIPITDDTDMEGDETIVLNITMASNNATIGTGTITITIQDNENVSISNLLPADAISMYPNPGNNRMVLESTVNMETVVVTNLMGQEVSRLAPNGREVEVNTSAFAQGTYLVRVITREGAWTQKWIKE